MEISPTGCRASELVRRENQGGAAIPSEAGRRRDQNAPVHKLHIRNFHPIGNTLFIDVELQEGQEGGGTHPTIPPWPDFQARRAFTRYQQVADTIPPRSLHTVDLFV